PDPKWHMPALSLGDHRSADGIAEYTSDHFGTGFQGSLLMAEFSSGDDIIAVGLDAHGNPTNLRRLPFRFQNPLGVAVDPVSGAVYVAVFGDRNTGSGGSIVALLPGS